MRMSLLALGIPLLALYQPAPTSQAQPAALSADAQRCAALMAADFEGVPDAPTRLTAARIVDVAAVPPETPPNAPQAVLAASPIKQYCQVLGYVAPQNKFELRLPLPSQWNGKFLLAPCAGFCGAVQAVFCNPSLARGYASITGNGGHDGGIGFDGLWAANSPGLQEDLAWRHNHVIALAGKAITAKYYGKLIARSYLSGCSKGGHAALMEAQRFPDDFDGLIAAAPVYDLVGRALVAAWWAQAVDNTQRGSILTRSIAEAVQSSVLARCGAQSGIDERVVTDPASCDWKPEMAACGTATGSTCLTAQQVQVVKKMMSPVVNSKGQALYTAADVAGTASEWEGWHYGRGGNSSAPRAHANYQIADQFLKYMADPTVRANADPLKFDFDRDPSTLARARKLYNATSPDLRAFKARGGKLVMWHGLSDAAITAPSSIEYYRAVEKLMGGRAQTQDFFRLFLLPGMHHCAGGPGFTEFDALTLLENWVEKGQAPDVMLASQVAAGATVRTRPIYPYPVLARYSGQGDPKQASSFVPFDPTKR